MSGTDERQTTALAEVTGGLAGLHDEYYGKGPDSARTYMIDDTAICFLEGGFTTVEETLIADGNADAVEDIRRSFQTAMERPFQAVVEKATDRKVLAYMSQIHTGPDLAVELFVLEPSVTPVFGEHEGEIQNDRSERQTERAPKSPLAGTRPSSAGGELLAGISTGLVQLHRRYYGKGPTKAKTFLVNDTVICVLRGGFTTVERTLIDDGNAEAVYRIRRDFQHAMEGHFTSVVEGAVGRKVVAYMSQIHQDPDLAVELFVLEPNGESVVARYEEELDGIRCRRTQAQ
jgi:uncharacterized protein YbcI